MFELITVILEQITKILNPIEIDKFRKEKKLREVGTKLFLVYIRLNEILVCGDEIVHSLETYVERMGRHLKHGNDKYALTAGNWIDYKIIEQRVNLAKFGRAIQELSNEIQIVDGDAFLRLRPLLEGKVNALDSLLVTLGHGNLPLLSPTEQELLDFSNGENERESKERFNIRKQIAASYTQGSVESSKEWDENIYKVVKQYLNNRKPRKQLELIREIAEQLRESLSKHFSVGDILLEVGDKRIKSKDIGDYFW